MLSLLPDIKQERTDLSPSGAGILWRAAGQPLFPVVQGNTCPHAVSWPQNTSCCAGLRNRGKPKSEAHTEAEVETEAIHHGLGWTDPRNEWQMLPNFSPK